MEDGELPERDFLVGLLCTLKSNEMKELIKEARDNRALSINSDANMMIEITDNASDQLLGLLPNKSKCFKGDVNSYSNTWKS